MVAVAVMVVVVVHKPQTNCTLDDHDPAHFFTLHQSSLCLNRKFDRQLRNRTAVHFRFDCTRTDSPHHFRLVCIRSMHLLFLFLFSIWKGCVVNLLSNRPLSMHLLAGPVRIRMSTTKKRRKYEKKDQSLPVHEFLEFAKDTSLSVLLWEAHPSSAFDWTTHKKAVGALLCAQHQSPSATFVRLHWIYANHFYHALSLFRLFSFFSGPNLLVFFEPHRHTHTRTHQIWQEASRSRRFRVSIKKWSIEARTDLVATFDTACLVRTKRTTRFKEK